MVLRDGTRLNVDNILDILLQKWNEAPKETPQEAPKKLTTTEEAELPNDFEACLKVVEFHFGYLLKTWPLRITLLKLPLPLLERILSSDRLVLGNEYHVFLMVKDWARLQLGEDLEAGNNTYLIGNQKTSLINTRV